MARPFSPASSTSLGLSRTCTFRYTLAIRPIPRLMAALDQQHKVESDDSLLEELPPGSRTCPRSTDEDLQTSPQHAPRKNDPDPLEHPHHQLQSKKDLSALCEVTDFETGAFQRCTFTYFDNQDFAWFGQTPGIRKYGLTIENIRASLEKVPDEKIYPVTPVSTPLLTTVPNVDRADFFIKRPQALLLDDEEETELLPRILLEEAEILEQIKRKPHPNIVHYHGCTVRRGRVTGIVLQRYKIILQYRYEDDERDFDIGACMRGIRAGVKHLHSLGLAHNDLNPMNIALNEQDNPVILDFGSCKRFGEQLLSAGTPGWIDESYDTSAAKHDESAIEKLEVWLRGKQSKKEEG